MKNNKLSKKQKKVQHFKDLYKNIQLVNSNRVVWPDLTDEEFEKFTSPYDWFLVPVFGSTSKRENTGSEKGHISISYKPIQVNSETSNKFFIYIRFNGVPAVKNFLNILHPLLKKNKEMLKDLIKGLGNEYRIKIDYDPSMLPSVGSPKWVTQKSINCGDFDDRMIEELLVEIKDLLIKRDEQQKTLPKTNGRYARLASVAISLGEITVEDENDMDKLKVISDNITELMECIKSIPTGNEMVKIANEYKKRKDNLELEKKAFFAEINSLIKRKENDINTVCKDNNLVKGILNGLYERKKLMEIEWESKLISEELI